MTAKVCDITVSYSVDLFSVDTRKGGQHTAFALDSTLGSGWSLLWNLGPHKLTTSVASLGCTLSVPISPSLQVQNLATVNKAETNHCSPIS